MDLLPRGAWFGLTRRRARLIAKISAWSLSLTLAIYGFGSAYLRYQVWRAEKLLALLQFIQISQDEASAARALSPFEDKAVARMMGYPPDVHSLRIDPLLIDTGFEWLTWLNRPLIAIHEDRENLRRSIGLRLWSVYGQYVVRDRKVDSVMAQVVVEGKNEWLLGEWNYSAKFGRLDAADSDSDEKLREPMNRYRSRWFHLHMGAGTGEGIHNAVLTAAKPDELSAARDINLVCLTKLQACRSLCELMPAAIKFRREHGYGPLGWNSGSWGPQDHSCE